MQCRLKVAYDKEDKIEVQQWSDDDVAQLVQQLRSPKGSSPSAALLQLRTLLSCNEPPLTLVIDLGAVPLLVVCVLIVWCV